MIRQWIQFLIVLLFGIDNNSPVNDLRRKPTREDNRNTVKGYLKNYFRRYGWIFVTLGIILGLMLFAFICFALINTGVESGNYYYHFKGVI